MGIQLMVEGSTIKKPTAAGHRRTGVRSSLPHLLTRQGSGEGKDSGSPTHRSATHRKDAGSRSLGHTEKQVSTATTSDPGKGKKGKAKSATSPVCLTLQTCGCPDSSVGHNLDRSQGLKQPEAWGNTVLPEYPSAPKVVSTCSTSPSQVPGLAPLAKGHQE